MKEIEITSGRMNPHIDPHLTIWGWEIPVYLFLGGLVAGILFFSAYFYIKGKKETLPAAVLKAPLFALPFLGLGMFALFLDLSHKLFVWRFYTAFRIESPMSWGSWTLAVIMPLTLLWNMFSIRELWPEFKWPFSWIDKILNMISPFRYYIAWALMILAVILGMYTGILLSAFNARPFWNTSILGPLFLVSGLSTGAALILLLSNSRQEKDVFTRIDIFLISVELFLIVHLFMGFLASTQVHIDAAALFLGGPYTATFWIFVVGFGLMLPLFIEIMHFRGKHLTAKIPAIMILIGGLILRFIVVDAGQTSRWLYKFME